MSSPPTLPVGTVARIFESIDYTGSSVLLQPYNSGVELPLGTLGWTTSTISVVLAAGYTLEFLTSEGQSPPAAIVTSSTLSFAITGYSHLKLMGGTAFTDTPLATIYANANFSGNDVQLMSWNIGVNTPWSILNLGPGPYSAELLTGYALEFRVNATDDLALFSVNLTNRSFTLTGNATYVRLIPAFRSKITLNLYDEEKFEQHFQIAQRYGTTTWTCPTPLTWRDATRQVDVFNLLLRIPAVESTLIARNTQQVTEVEAGLINLNQDLAQLENVTQSTQERIVAREESVTSSTQRLDSSLLPLVDSEIVVTRASLASLASRVVTGLETDSAVLVTRLKAVDEWRTLTHSTMETLRAGGVSLVAPIDTIGSELTALSGTLGALDETLDVLHERLAGAADFLVNVESRIDTAQGTGTATQSRVQTAESRITSLQTRLMDTMDAPLQSIESRLDTRVMEVLDAATRLIAWQTTFDNLESRTQGLESEQAGLHTKLNSNTLALEEIGGRVSTASSLLSIRHSAVQSLDSVLIDVHTQMTLSEVVLDEVHTALDEADATQITLAARIAARETDTASMTNRLIGGVESQLTPLDTRCVALTSDLLLAQNAILAIVDAEGETGWSSLVNITSGMIQNPLRALIHVQDRLAYLESVVEVLVEQQQQ